VLTGQRSGQIVGHTGVLLAGGGAVNQTTWISAAATIGTGQGGGCAGLGKYPRLLGIPWRQRPLRDKGLLFHTGLRLQRSRVCAKIANFITLVGGKHYIPACVVSASKSNGGSCLPRRAARRKIP
jgi:hypothetical protein